jgi:hypothetical protein
MTSEEIKAARAFVENGIEENEFSAEAADICQHSNWQEEQQAAVERGVQFKACLSALNAYEKLLPLCGNLDARVRAVAVPGVAETLQGSYQLGCVDVLRVVRNSLGLPRKSDEPKLYVED